jgi:DNA-binding IclR family transcriptional regulator
MGQQVWAFLQKTGESWSVADLVRILDMPESTVRGQLDRLMTAGKVIPRDVGPRFVFKAAP